MSVQVKIGRSVVVIDEYEWTGKDKPLVKLLNSMLDPSGPSGADPAPDLHAAQAAIKELGGKVLKADEVEHVEGRIY